MEAEKNMSSIASVSHGDGDKIPEDLEDYFSPNFREYMLNEQLKWSRFKHDFFKILNFGWVFWSKKDHRIEPSLYPDNWSRCNNIRHALEKLTSLDSFTAVGVSLVQFWAPTKTSEGRTRLSTQYQPFALFGIWKTIKRQQLCEYRMKMCSSKYNNCFYTDAKSGEEQLGLPGRVFLHQYPESTPNVKYYSIKEYPQRDLALRCKIQGSWAVPVFEHSCPTCVGVLEIVSQSTMDDIYRKTRNFHRDMQKISQEFGLRCLNGYDACEKESRKKGKRLKGLTHDSQFQKVKTLLQSVCQIHELPLAMTWVPCSACNGLRRLKVNSAVVEFCSLKDSFLDDFLKVNKCWHLRKGLVAERAHSSRNMLYCPDITQFSLDEYPLVHYARRCNLSGWFTIYLLCKHTGNFIYVLEFFLSARSKDDEKTTLSLILGTIAEKFTTFRFASGKELGELIPVEVIHFQENQKIHSLQSIQAARDFSMSSIPSSSVQSSASVANTRPGFQDENMGTINAEYDLNSDSSSDSNSSSDSDHSFEQSTMVTMKAKYACYTIKFMLSLPCRLEELQEEVAKRLELLTGTYQTFYKDVSGELILIDCDKDLQACVNTSILLGNTSTVVFLEPK